MQYTCCWTDVPAHLGPWHARLDHGVEAGVPVKSPSACMRRLGWKGLQTWDD